MAVHKLGDETYKTLPFHPQLWMKVNTQDIGDILDDMYPPIERMTSLSENVDLSWFYGSVGVVGMGRVRVLYPYEDDTSNGCIFRLKNVDFSVFPFIHLQAIPYPEWQFVGWKSSEKEMLSSEPDLIIYEKDYLDITGFLAVFQENTKN